MVVPRPCDVSQVSLNARVMMSFSFAFTSGSFQKYSWRPCTHSKYETTTPPAFASTSGRIRIPRSSRIGSAPGVTGPFAPSQALERAGLLLVRDRRHDVDPVRVVQAAGRVGDRDHLGPLFGEELGQVATDVSEALNGDAEAVEREAQLRHRLEDAVEGAPRGCLLAPERASDHQGLAGDDTEHRMALVHRVRVEDPGHDARVRPHVGRGNIALRSDLVDDLARVAARHPFELEPRKRLRVADDAALGAAERDPHQRTLPRHPHREGLDLVLRDVGVVADPSLRRAARNVVGDAVALEHLRRAVVHSRRDRDRECLLALAEDGDEVGVDPEGLADEAELLARELEWVLAKV